MGFSASFYRIAGALVIAGTLPACNSLQTSAPPNDAAMNTPLPPRPSGPRQRGWLSPQIKSQHKRLLYVANETGSEVEILPEKGRGKSPIGTITAGIDDPWGLYVDSGGNLYVANQGSESVTVYPPGATAPSLTLSQDLSRPLYAIADHAGNVFVGNSGGPSGGIVVEYLAGSTSAFQVRTTPGNEVDGMAFDQQGNLYVAWRNGYSEAGIEKFPPTSTTGELLGMSLTQPQGLVVDDSGNILVVETGGPNRIDLFPPGSDTPSLEVPLLNDVPSELAMIKRERRLILGAESGTVYTTSYPFGSAPSLTAKDTVSGEVQGVALSNGQ